jgi:hypothetical protein
MKIKLILFLTAIFQIISCSNINKDFNSRFVIYDKFIDENNLTLEEEINTFKFQGWNSLDNYHIILSSYQHKFYLITLSNYCNDINISPNIIIDQSINNKLDSNFDSIIVPSQYNIKCKIRTIHSLNRQQKNDLLSLTLHNK